MRSLLRSFDPGSKRSIPCQSSSAHAFNPAVLLLRYVIRDVISPYTEPMSHAHPFLSFPICWLLWQWRTAPSAFRPSKRSARVVISVCITNAWVHVCVRMCVCNECVYNEMWGTHSVRMAVRPSPPHVPTPLTRTMLPQTLPITSYHTTRHQTRPTAFWVRPSAASTTATRPGERRECWCSSRGRRGVRGTNVRGKREGWLVFWLVGWLVGTCMWSIGGC